MTYQTILYKTWEQWCKNEDECNPEEYKRVHWGVHEIPLDKDTKEFYFTKWESSYDGPRKRRK